MFKSIFAKYITTQTAIVTAGFTILLLLITLIVGSFSAKNTTEMMESTAKIAATALTKAVEESDDKSLSNCLEGETAEELSELLRSLLGGKDMVVVVFDRSGEMLQSFSVRDPASVTKLDGRVPTSVLTGISKAEAYVGSPSLAGYDGEPIAAAKIGDEGGVAIVFFDIRFGFAIEELTNTVFASAFLVLLSMLVAGYVLTMRITTPLHEMSIAARSFAAGNFNVRVQARGKDEVAELAVAFNQMADSLENLEKLRSTFIANVSHDLRTPMTTIAGFIDSIRDGVIPPEEQDHYLGVVSEEVHRLSRLVSSLLDLSRIQAGDRKFVMKSFDICEMARLILISFEAEIDRKRLDVEFECEDERMQVLADRDAIYQIFYNICHNAVKFSREGGKLRVCIENTKEKKLCVSVFNEGEGIPAEDQPMIFERFYKSDKSRGLDKSGVGLGLYIAKTIITAHGERIGVHSTPGKDCEFFFTLQPAAHGITRESADE